MEGEHRHDIHFRLEEANKLVKDLEPKVGDILELRHRLDAKGFDIATMSFVEEDRKEETVDDVEEILDEIQRLLEEIHETGALFKDPKFEKGMLDFPYITQDGREVYLCWMHGEDDISYYHPIKEGMKGRKKIEEL